MSERGTEQVFEAPAATGQGGLEAKGRARRIATPRTAAEQLVYDYESVRLFTHRLADPLPVEDQVVQSMESVSPTKWHLAHTSWFFERFILHAHVPDYRPYHETYYYLFNSYYNGAGPQHCRASRGLISRPTVREVDDYRRHIDERMIELMLRADEQQLAILRPLVILGLHHEQQHQELMLTDIKHVYSSNPLLPAYEGVSSSKFQVSSCEPFGEAQWINFEPGLHEIGHVGEGFYFDNETPRHKTYLHGFALASRPVTNGEFLAFLEDGGYEKPELWLSMGFDTVQREGWKMPLYWYRDGGRWMQYTLAGPVELAMDEPVSHLSYFEADAFARWCGLRLPTEAEWEVAARDEPIAGNFVESLRCHPASLREDASEWRRLQRCFGDVWEWTQSQYSPYPGYKPLEGTLGEYNGKFMCNQFVLRGGSCATSRDHIRLTYRNFFAPEARWQFTGLRLARDGTC
ncbi:MAG: ergothioneine biosynthesis protein EgtB [Phycisphaeraceae bacterium]